MVSQKVNFWNSLVSRFALLFTGLNIIAILGVGYLVYNQAAGVIIANSQERMQYISSLATQSFYSLLGEVANDIAVTTNNPVLDRYIEMPAEAQLEDIQELFQVLLENKPQYFQIRLLDVNDNGKELVRYDKVDEAVTQIREDQLQFKGERNYYQEALKIEPGNYYYSDITLNEEFGKVSIPHTPTLRVLGQVYDRDQTLQALLVINVDLSGYYQELNQIMESGYRLMMVNEAGDYLFAPELEQCFGNQLGTDISFTKDFGRAAPSLISHDPLDYLQDSQSDNYLCHIETLDYSPGQRIYLISMSPDNLIMRSAQLVRNDSLQMVLLVCFISLLVALFFIRIFSTNINQITQAVSSYEEDSSQSIAVALPENRKDELGMLARTFARMRKRIDQQLSDLKVSLGREQKAIRERDQFLQNMSHELRTPLNAILGLSRLLNKNNPNEAQKPIIESINRSALNLSGLMHDILDHQKLTEGKVRLQMKPVNYADVLSDIHQGYRYEAINKGLLFDLEVEEALKHQQYLTDPLRFNQIITNLVINAIKYTDQGSVTLKASEIEDHQIKITVTDTGRGIKPENLQKIEERYFREKREADLDEEGYGLGLSIVMQLVDLFEGQVQVKSDPQAGSSFTVCLPLIPVNKVSQSDTPIKSDDSYPLLNEKYSILHLEDDPSTLLLVAHGLEIPNVSITQRTSFDPGNTLDGLAPDLILSDLMLNNQPMDDSLLKIQESKNIPMVLLSAFEPPRMQSISPYFLQKPFDLSTLKNLTIILLGGKEYDSPSLESVYEQYDHQPQKIKKFLDILQQEFKQYLERFETVYLTKNEKEWQAIMHKFTTHIKSLGLKKLSVKLPENAALLDQSTIDFVKNSLLYCLCVFRNEQRTLNLSQK
jgi:signal transduction histidine kinase/CheY-like chemotaxis protein